MKIEIKYMKSEIERLNQVISEYENNFLNLKNSFNSVSFFWRGNLADDFKQTTNDNLKKAELNYEDLCNVKYIYNEIISQYQNIGQKIYFEKANKNKILQYISSIIYQIDSIIESYNSLNYVLNHQLATYFENERRKIYELKKQVNTYKEDINNIYNKFDEIEKKISQEIYRYQTDEYQIN